jgi:TonB-linked SusC/RagA family outer membrane protein
MKKIKPFHECDFSCLTKTFRIMRITVFLMLAVILQTFANEAYSQKTKLSLDYTNTRLEVVLDEIEELSEFFFLANEKLVDLDRSVNLSVKNKKIDEILDMLFAGTDVVYTITDRKIILAPSFLTEGAQQQRAISGKVTDSGGQPLPGVTVVVKGTTQGTVTNNDGNYSLADVPDDATLVFSFVGMRTQEVVAGNQTTIDVRMEEETIGIEEVVAIGYGTQKKSHLTAAVDQIEGEILENRPIRSIADGLIGTVAGLNVRAPSGAPGASPNLNIRGFTGFGSQGQPLILVDGIERDIDEINPNDVASISVLKDGAASAIYGSRAPYGVVLITTKSGEKGEDIKINYSLNLRYGTPYGLPEHQESYEWARFVNEGFRNQPGGGVAPFFSEKQIAQMEAFAAGDYSNPIFDGIDPEHVPYGTYAISETQWAGHTESFANTKWLDILMADVQPSQEHNINVSGGGEQTSYYVGLGYNESVGIYDIPDYKNRYSALIKTDTEVTSWLDFNIRANYVRISEESHNLNNSQGQFEGFARMYLNWALYNPNGSYARFNALHGLRGESGRGYRINDELILSPGVVIEPIKDFKIFGNFTWQNSSIDFENYRFAVYQILPNGNSVLTQRSPGNSWMDKSKTNNNYYTVDLHASYFKTLGEKHNFSGLIGYQEEEYSFDKLNGRATHFYSNAVPTLSTASAGFKTSDQLYDWATRGFFGRFSYNFAEKYFIEFNGRRDATSRFKKDDRWGFFPSVSGAWNIAKENFWPLEELVSLFKIRSSWSTSGDANVGLYPFYPAININVSNSIILNNELVSVAKMPNLVSENLTWAKPTTLNFGFDADALDNRLNVMYDWYQRTVADQFGPPPSVPKTIGATVPKSNNAVSETRGWEFSIRWKDRAFNILNSALRYNVQFRMNDYIGYVVEYEHDGTGAIAGQWIPGQVFGVNYHYTSNGIMQNQNDLYKNTPGGNTWYYPGDLAYKDTSGDGEIHDGLTNTWYSRGDVKENGYNYPRKNYGINLGLDWKNFDVSIMLDGVGHWKTYTSQMYVFGVSGSQWYAPYFKKHAELGYWSPDNTNAFYPRNSLNNKNRSNPNDQYALDLSHLRIRNVKLGYNFPQVLIEKIKIQRLYAYLSAENLGFIYYNSFINYDPELLSDAGGQGYPPQQFFSFGLNIEHRFSCTSNTLNIFFNKKA